MNWLILLILASLLSTVAGALIAYFHLRRKRK